METRRTIADRINQSLRVRWVPYALIGFIGLAVWGHTIRYQFVWDDRQFIQDLESIRSLSHIPRMFYSLEAQSSYPEGFKLFRPLRTVHYAVLYQLGGKNAPAPWLFHAANIVWHSAAAMLLYSVTFLLLQRLRPDQSHNTLRWISLWTALAFALHPVITEVVCWAKCLDDAMALVFTLAALRCLLTWDGQTQGYCSALFWFLLAVYSKISAVPFALAAVFIFRFVLKVPWRRAWGLASGFGAVALLFMVHRHLVIGQSSQTAPISGSYAQTLLDMLPVAPAYLRLLLGIPPFCIDYSFMKGHCAAASWPVVSGLLVLAGGFVLGVWALQLQARDGQQALPLSKGNGPGEAGSDCQALPHCCVHKGRRHPLLALGLLWIGLFLLPVSNLLPMMQYMAERFLYMPLIGWLWMLALLLVSLPRPRLLATLAVVLLGSWAAVGWERSWIWQDEVTLFVQSSQAGPKTQRVQDNAVAAILALPHVRTMFTLDPKQGVLRVTDTVPEGSLQPIHDTLAEAHRLFPDDERLSSALAIVCARSGRLDQAIPLFQAAADKSPHNARPWANLGQACVEMKSWPQAEKALRKALTIDPNQTDALQAFAALAWHRDDYAAALAAFQKLKTLEPNEPEHDHWIQKAEAKLQSSP